MCFDSDNMLFKWCFFALLLCGVNAAANESVKSYKVCAPTDGPGMCLFKGLLKNAIIYMSRRNDVKTTADSSNNTLQESKGIEDYLIEQIQNIFGLFSFGFDLPEVVPWSLLKSSFFNGEHYS